MTIEFSNTIEPRNHPGVAVAIVIAACLFFFVPTTLIVLGYYASQPTGTLISPLPQGILSSSTTRNLPSDNQDLPLVAAPNESTKSADTTIVPEASSNIIDKTATISAGLSEIIIDDPDARLTSQIYLSPKPGDKSIYSVQSKTDGQFTISISPSSDTVRYVDYHIVNP